MDGQDESMFFNLILTHSLVGGKRRRKRKRREMEREREREREREIERDGVRRDEKEEVNEEAETEREAHFSAITVTVASRGSTHHNESLYL